jgi:hypothetical protein
VTRTVWFWFLVGWGFSALFGPRQLIGMFGKKSS